MAYTPVTTVVAGNKGTATWGNAVSAAVGELQTALPDAWTAYTPVLGGTGWALGTGGGGGAFGTYHVAGDFVAFHARAIFGTSGATFGAAMPTLSIPITSTESAGGLPLWNTVFCQYVDVSPSASYEGKGLLSGGVVGLGIISVNATYPVIGLLSNTVPFTWAASDEFQVSGWYRKA